MKTTRPKVLIAAAFVAVSALTIGRAADITLAEVRAIAEEGFIFGMPIVMNYAVMYEYAVDRSSGHFKAPFNQIYNEARIFTYEDTAILAPDNDTPYSLLWADLRAEPIVISVPEVLGTYMCVPARPSVFRTGTPPVYRFVGRPEAWKRKAAPFIKKTTIHQELSDGIAPVDGKGSPE